MNDVLETIARRRSLRRFKPDQLADAELAAVLEAGLQAPSGHNDQSWYFAVVQDAARIDELSLGCKRGMTEAPVDWIADLGRNERFHVFYNAPTVVIVAGRKDAVSSLPDACAAIQNMLLAAESLGIGSCWIGFAHFYFRTPEDSRRLGIPDGYKVHYGVALGYKPDGAKQEPPRRKRDSYYHIIR